MLLGRKPMLYAVKRKGTAMENLKQHVLSQLPQLINSMKIEAHNAAIADAPLVKAEIRDNNFLVNDHHEIIVSCLLKCLRPNESFLWKTYYTNQLREEFGKDQIGLLEVKFDTEWPTGYATTRLIVKLKFD